MKRVCVCEQCDERTTSPVFYGVIAFCSRACLKDFMEGEWAYRDGVEDDSYAEQEHWPGRVVDLKEYR